MTSTQDERDCNACGGLYSHAMGATMHFERCPSLPAAETKRACADASQDRLLHIDDARFALFDAIRKIKIGNPTDDKLILENLREAGFWICRTSNDQIAASSSQGPIAWTGSGSLSALKAGVEGHIWPSPEKSHPIPLYAAPRTPATGERDDLRDAREVVAKWRIGYGEAIRAGEAWQEMVEAVRMGIAFARDAEETNK